MTQIQRITQMEDYLNQSAAVVNALAQALEDYLAIQPQLQALSDYYGSSQWHADRADDEAGRLPSELRRGVLSEDGAYNVLMDHRQLLADLKQLAQSDHADQV